MTHSVTFAILAGALTLAAAPRAIIEPAQPKWGDRIQLVYHSDGVGAKLHNGDEVVALVTIWYPESVEERRVPMLPEGGHLQAGLTVPEHASFVQCYFVTKDAYDGPATARIWNADGRPARGAWQTSMTQPYLAKDYRDRAARELALYPDNWAVYRDTWFLAAKEPDRVEGIRKDMALIAREAPGRPLAALYALSYGHLLLGQEAEARNVTGEMVRRFPDELLTYWSISSYEYEAMVEHFTGDGPKEVRGWRLEFMRRNPTSSAARSDISSMGSDGIPAGIMEAICRPWIEEDPRNPKAYIPLVEAWQRENVNAAEAQSYIEKALTLALQGEMRLHGDIFGKISEFVMPSLFTMASRLALRNGNQLAALAYAKTAESIGPQTRPEGFAMEAKVWESLGHPAMAAEALQGGWQRGDKKTAPAFQATALDGSSIDSEQLRGKVIVANFWFTGCGPCKAEIPDLNKLAAEFQGKDVVFLAFSLDDDPAALRRFLAEHPFQYTIVPKSGGVADAFGIKIYPSHVIVGPDGKIQSMLEGGGENAASSMRTVIARLLGSEGRP